MALVKCPDCAGQLSTEAIACPHCGRPNRQPAQPTVVGHQVANAGSATPPPPSGYIVANAGSAQPPQAPQQTLPPTISLASTFTKNPSSSPSSGNPLAALLARLQGCRIVGFSPIVVKSLWGVVALFVLLVVSGVIGSLVGSREKLRDERYPNGALRARGRVRQDPQKDLVLVGRWTYWYPNGQKEAEGDYREARDSGKRGATGLLMDGREGPWILWHPNGQKKQEGIYNSGKLEGTLTIWHENGKKKSETPFKDGKREGTFTSWYENGQKESEANFKDDKANGPQTIWYPSGQKQQATLWKDDKKEGPGSRWYDNGQKSSDTLWRDDQLEGPDTDWYENGQKKAEVILKNGKANGPLSYWYDNGQKACDALLRDDQLEGPETDWYENGQKKAEVIWKNGKARGVTWDINGTKFDANVAAGKKDGNLYGQPMATAIDKVSALSKGLPGLSDSQQTTPTVDYAPVVEAERQPKLGEDFRLGDFTYNVKRVTSSTTIGSGFAKKRASEGARFVVVEYTILNESNVTETVLADDFRIVDSQKREYRPSSEANTALMMSGETKDFVISEVQPGIKKKMQTAFEMPEASVMGGFTLVIPEKGLLGTGSVRISLR